MSDVSPKTGRIAIDWKRGPEGPDDFSWQMTAESPGLTDDQMALLLKSVAEGLSARPPGAGGLGRASPTVVERQAVEMSYDAEADMAYVRVVASEPGASIKQVLVHDSELPSELVIDIDRDGRIRGFELFEAAKSLPLKVLDELR